MILEQLKYLCQLDSERQKKWLAGVLVEKFKTFHEAIALNDKREALRIVNEELKSLANPRPPYEIIKHIKGVSITEVLSNDILRYLEIEEKIEDLIWRAENSKRTIVELRNETIAIFKKCK